MRIGHRRRNLLHLSAGEFPLMRRAATIGIRGGTYLPWFFVIVGVLSRADSPTLPNGPYVLTIPFRVGVYVPCMISFYSHGHGLVGVGFLSHQPRYRVFPSSRAFFVTGIQGYAVPGIWYLVLSYVVVMVVVMGVYGRVVHTPAYLGLAEWQFFCNLATTR